MMIKVVCFGVCERVVVTRLADSDKLSLYLKGRVGYRKCLSFTGVHCTVNILYTSLSNSEAGVQDVYTDLTLGLLSSQVFILLLLLVPMNLISTCKENRGTFLATFAPYHQDQSIWHGQWIVMCWHRDITDWKLLMRVTSEQSDPVSGVRVIARICHHLHILKSWQNSQLMFTTHFIL